MAKVGAKLGGTIPTTQYANIRPDLEITDIDTTQDVDSQLKVAKEVLQKVWATIIDEYNTQVLEVAQYKIEDSVKAALRKKFQDITDEIEAIKKNQLK